MDILTYFAIVFCLIIAETNEESYIRGSLVNPIRALCGQTGGNDAKKPNLSKIPTLRKSEHLLSLNSRKVFKIRWNRFKVSYLQR